MNQYRINWEIRNNDNDNTTQEAGSIKEILKGSRTIDKSIFDEQIVIPEVEIDDMIAKNTLTNISFGITKKQISSVSSITNETK